MLNPQNSSTTYLRLEKVKKNTLDNKEHLSTVALALRLPVANTEHNNDVISNNL